MRNLLLSLLLATAVTGTPALGAQDRDNEARPQWGDRQESRPDHQQAREERGQAHEQARDERSQAREQARQERSGGDRPQFEQRQEQFEARQQDRVREQQIEAQQQYVRQQQDQSNDRSRFGGRQRADGVSRWNRDNVQQAGETSRWTRDPNQRSGEVGRWTRDRSGWTGERNRSRDYGDYRQSRESTRQVTKRGRWTNGGWNRNWRNDARYDWRRYRDRNRSVFHLGIYIDPFNYGYRPFNIGYRLQPLYYTQDYWFDPGMYGLPYPQPGTRWIRYWNDALLVDIYTGEVVDAIQNFFW